MKRLSGGQVLLNLTAISLGLTSGEVSISDADVLGELTELRNFIDVNRDFSKGFKNLKPVLIEYRSSASKFNGIALANLSFNTDALHMSIGANTIQDDGKMLVITINVVYEWVDYIGYQVKTAKLNAYETLATGDGTFTGDVGVGGDLEVTGDASVGGDLSVTGKINNVTDPSVKPIYCHPIQIERVESDVQTAELTMLIFNNSATAFTKTSFLDWLDDLFTSVGSTIRIMISGGWKQSGQNSLLVASYLGKYASDSYYIMGMALTGVALIETFTREEFEEFITSITDGVNKIN